MQQMAACPHCGAPAVPGQGFCAACGQSTLNVCANCNSQMDPTARFCPNCGSSVGIGTKFKDIQGQITRSEVNINAKLMQLTTDMQGFLMKGQDEMRNIITGYFNDIKSSYGVLNTTIANINQLLAEEHKLTASRRLHKIGLAVIGVGLAVVGMSYVVSSPEFAAGGAILSAAGFLLQFISNFMSK